MRVARLTASTAAALAAAAAGGTAASAWLADGSRAGGSIAAGTIALGTAGFVQPTVTTTPLSTISGLEPGGAASDGPVRALLNAGSAPAQLRVRPEAPSSPGGFATRLEVGVLRCADSACATPLGTTTWSAATSNANVALGTVAPGATTYLRFSVRWPAGTGDAAFFGQTTSLPVRINLVSAATPAAA